MNTHTEQTTSVPRTAPPPDVSANKTSTWLVPMMIGGVVGVVASFLLTTSLIAGDPSSTASLAYLVTVPVGLTVGVFLGTIFRWRFPKA